MYEEVDDGDEPAVDRNILRALVRAAHTAAEYAGRFTPVPDYGKDTGRALVR